MAVANSAVDESHAVLWEELQIGPIRVKNRVALNPLTTLWSHEGVLSERHLDYYEERAAGGLGLLISEQHIADRRRISGFRNSSSALEPRNIPMLTQLGDRVHAHGAAQFIQLYCPGSLDSSYIDVDGFSPIWAPSMIPSAAHGEAPEAMGRDEIRELRSGFVEAARNVATAGLDGVELHGSHSWLLHRFISPLFNHRTDEYGGSAEGRTRLVREIAAEIREAVDGLALGIQLSIDDYRGSKGVTVDYVDEELGLFVAEGLFDYINLSTGNELTDEETIPPMERPDIPVERYGARARGVVGPDVKILVGGGVRDIDNAARLVRDGVADFVAMARPILADPAIVRKAQEGRAHEIRPCIATNDCFRSAVEWRGVTCTMNPFAGRERRWRADRRSDGGRNVVVVGGGPAGLQAATAAAERGHNVTLLEREQATGGHLRLLASLPHRARWHDAIDWFDSAARRAGVEIRTGVEVTPDSPELASADVVLYATGSSWQKTGFSPARPEVSEIAGAEADNVITIDEAGRRALADPAALGQSVLIADETGDYLPLGIADLVSEAGARVELVTRHSGVAHRVTLACDHNEVYARLAARDVSFRPGHLLDAVDGDRVALIELWSGRSVNVPGVDTVVLSMGREPNAELFAAAAPTGPDARLIGDARAPRKMREVVAEGQEAGFGI
jgi:2,4-dienoyl-CoA reductase-like NADH-dependent reductase (Old Yellow Enzyme family)/thioredoxin reductase